MKIFTWLLRSVSFPVKKKSGTNGDPKAPVPLLVPRVAVTSSQTVVWRWESTDGAYRKAPGMTHHPMLAWAPQSAGDREFAPRDPTSWKTPPHHRPYILLCPYPACVFRTNWKFLTPWSGSMQVPVLSPHPNTGTGRPVDGQPHPHRSSSERELRLGEVNKNKWEPAAPSPRVHASPQNKVEAADSKGKRMLACQRGGGGGEDQRAGKAREAVCRPVPQVRVAKPCPHTSYSSQDLPVK